MKKIFLLLILQISAYAEARVTFVRGNVSVTLSGKVSPVKVGDLLPLNTQVQTGTDGKMALNYGGENFVIPPGRNIRIADIPGLAAGVGFTRQFLENPERPARHPVQAAGVRANEQTSEDLAWYQEGVDEDKADDKLWKLFKARRYPEILRALERAETPQRAYLKGLALGQSGQEAKAITELGRAIQMTSDKAFQRNIRVSIATLRTRNGEYNEALKVLRTILHGTDEKEIPAPVWYLLARNASLAGEEEKAAEYTRKLKAYFPDAELTRSLQNGN